LPFAFVQGYRIIAEFAVRSGLRRRPRSGEDLTMIWWIAGCALIALLLYVGVTFNELVAERNQVRAAWADIDVQLQRRHDLVPQLAATVKGYAEHELSTLSAITELRARAQAGGTIAQRGQIETKLAAQVTQLLALQERYPDLKASGNFLQLQRDLVDVEDHLQYARRFYNGAVRQYNTHIQHFPELLLAQPFGFRPQDFFQAEDREAVKL
jgi:LemA protein